MATAEDSKALKWRITEEIWNNGRLELIDDRILDPATARFDGLATILGVTGGAVHPPGRRIARHSIAFHGDIT
jgi:hypothetical protein